MAAPQFPYDDETLTYFDLLQTGQAWKKDPVVISQTFTKGLSDVSAMISAFGIPELAQHANQLDYYSTGQAAALTDHLNWHYDNLPTNLSLMSGYITDLSALSRLPGYNDTASYSSGGYTGLAGVSSRAMMISAPSVFMMAETGSGSSGGSPTSGQCNSMGGAFGSIMGMANQLLGGAQGLMGQVQGLMGGLMGGGVLGAISKFANMAGLSNIPGIGQLGNLVSGIGNIGNLGQIGSLVSNIGQFANVGALGSTLTNLLGGSGSALGNLTKLGSTIQSMAGYASSASSIGGVPVMSTPFSPYAVQSQVMGLQDQLSSFTSPGTTSSLRTLASQLSTLLLNNPSTSTDTTLMVAQTQAAAGGNISTLVSQLNGLADHIDGGNISTLGDLTPTVKLLQQFGSAIGSNVPASADVSALMSNINSAVSVVSPLSAVNMQGLTTQLGSLSNQLGSYGGSTGFGNVSSIMGQAQSIVGSLGNLSSIPGIGQAFSGLTSMIPNMQGMIGNFANILPGNIGSVIGNISGIAGNMSGLINSIGSGNIGSLLGNLPGGLGGITGQLGSLIGGGGLGGVMGKIGSMIGGEKGLINAATGALTAIAGSFNLKSLKNNACASSVLGNVGSDALQAASGSPSGAGSADMNGSTAPDAINNIPDDQVTYTGTGTPGQVYDNLNAGQSPSTGATGNPTAGSAVPSGAPTPPSFSGGGGFGQAPSIPAPSTGASPAAPAAATNSTAAQQLVPNLPSFSRPGSGSAGGIYD